MRASSFNSLPSYLNALMQTPQRLVARATAVHTPEQELTETQSRSGACMRRRLGLVDLVGLGVGGMVGAGVFVTTGSAAHLHAGPAVVLSFLIAGLSALLSALCYTEFAVELPAAGGAFSYLRITLGELAAYLTGANLLLEYVISNAAVARTFTSYLATIFGHHGSAWLIRVPGLAGEGDYMLDFPAVGIITLLTISICCSTKQSSFINMGITCLHLALMLFIVVAGLMKGEAENLWKPGRAGSPAGFAPFGVRGVLEGAAVVYFSFIGFDAVSTMAEEVEKPSRNMPIGVTGSVVIVTVLYCLMAMAMVLLLPYDEIDVEAPFSAAFQKVIGWSWAAMVVGGGACLGILSSLLVAMLGQARYLCVMARCSLIPPWLAKVDDRSGTPVQASLFLGLLTGGIALTVESAVLVDLISIGTLFVFYMVANALIYRRHVIPGLTNPWPTAAYLASATALSAAFAWTWHREACATWRAGTACAAGLVACAVAFRAWVPPVQKPNGHLAWHSCTPWLATLSIFVNVFLAASLGQQAFLRFALWSLVSFLFYLAYGLHSSHDAADHHQLLYHELPLTAPPKDIR